MTTAESNNTIAEQRAAAVADMLARVRDIETTQGITRHALNEMREALYKLAEQKELFPKSDFPRRPMARPTCAICSRRMRTSALPFT